MMKKRDAQDMSEALCTLLIIIITRQERQGKRENSNGEKVGKFNRRRAV
jgi:hypothetical protein